jgi:energy-coupling factor transport system permease protein
VFYACFLFSTLVFWDFRYLLFFFAIALFFVLTSRITWRESRRAWTFIGFFILFYTTLTFLTGRGGMEVYEQETLITSIQAPFTIFGWTPTIQITVERIFFAISQFLRLFSISSMTILIPYSLNPAHYGVAFHGLGMPDKFAYAMDLTMRFIPTFGRDFQLTLDAQRARGYELEKLSGGLVAQVRKMAPLIIPVTIHALIGSEDIIDAMDLRAFGIGKRSWLEKLTYRKRDYFLIPLRLNPGWPDHLIAVRLENSGYRLICRNNTELIDVPASRQEAVDMAQRECAADHQASEAAFCFRGWTGDLGGSDEVPACFFPTARSLCTQGYILAGHLAGRLGDPRHPRWSRTGEHAYGPQPMYYAGRYLQR